MPVVQCFFSAARTKLHEKYDYPYLERIAATLKENGVLRDDTLLQFLSPLGWEHINLTGDYRWRRSSSAAAKKFRPLRPANRA